MKKFTITSLLLGLSLASTVALAQCDVDTGKVAFNKCIACHSVDKSEHRLGPSLHNVMNSPAGKSEGYLYSIAMEQSGVTWGEAQLDAFLKNPMANIPGTSMPFAGLKKDSDRAAIICYLSSLR